MLSLRIKSKVENCVKSIVDKVVKSAKTGDKNKPNSKVRYRGAVQKLKHNVNPYYCIVTGCINIDEKKKCDLIKAIMRVCGFEIGNEFTTPQSIPYSNQKLNLDKGDPSKRSRGWKFYNI